VRTTKKGLSTDYADFRRFGSCRATNSDPGGVTAISRGLSEAIPPVRGTEFEFDPGGVAARRRSNSGIFQRAARDAGTPPGCVRFHHRTGGIVRKRRTQPPANGWHPSGVHLCRGHTQCGSGKSLPAGETCHRRHRIGLAILACFVLLVAGCGADARVPQPAPPPAEALKPARELRIAAAADLKFVLVDLVAAFEKSHPGATITVTTGSSGSFFAQLTNEAPFDLFLSADVSYPQRLVKGGQGVKESQFEYAIGHLVVWVPKDSALDVENRGVDVLRDDAVQKIAVANPKTAPYGRAAFAALQSLQVHDVVEPRLVFGENVAQTAQMTESGGADVGIISLSLAVSPTLRDKGKYWKVPGDAHPPIVQGGVVLRWAQDAALAGEFRDFLLSAEGRTILGQYGFETAGE
jgi:molybdate transport system substrate-binding protein